MTSRSRPTWWSIPRRVSTGASCSPCRSPSRAAARRLPRAHAAGRGAAAGAPHRLRQRGVRQQLLHRVPRQQGSVREHGQLAGARSAGALAPAPAPGARRGAVLRLERAGERDLLGHRRRRAGPLRRARAGARRLAAAGLTMRWRQVALLYLVLAALAGEYWFVEGRMEPPARTEAPAPPSFLRLDPATLREVRLVRGSRTVVSRREGAGWTIVEPAGAPI